MRKGDERCHAKVAGQHRLGVAVAPLITNKDGTMNLIDKDGSTMTYVFLCIQHMYT